MSDIENTEEWTLEIGPMVSIVGSSVFEEMDPEFYAKVCKVIGDDGWFYAKDGDGPWVVATGDPFDEPEYWTIHEIPE